MRKVKLLALLLAVLMVVTAFAGCANTDVIESDVANLDERVTALENLLNGIDKELDDTNAKLEDTNKKLEDTNAKIEEVDSKIDKLDETLKGDKTDEEVAALKAQLDAQKASLDAQAKLLAEQTKTLQEQAKTAEAQKKAIEDQLKVLENQVAAQNKTNEDLLATIQQMLKDQADKEAAEKAEAEAEKALNSAKTAALLQIAGIEGANPGKYILQIAIAKATVESASTVEAANKAVTDLNTAIEIAKSEEEAAAAAALAAAKETANTQITIIENANPGKYATEIANAKAAVEAATTTAEVTKAVTDLSAAIAKAEQDAADAAAAAAAAALKAAKDGALVEIAAVEAANAGKYADLFAAAKAAVEAATTAEAAAKAVTDLKDGVELKKATEAAAEAAAQKEAAQRAAAVEIEAIRAAKKDEKGLYLVEEYDAVIKALAAADTSVAAAETAAEVATALETLKAELAKYAAIDDKLYDYFTKLWNNLTEDNRALNTEAQAYLEKVNKQIKDAQNGNSVMTVIEAMSLQQAMLSYVYGKGEDGFDDKINLVNMLEGINRVYVTGATTDVTFAAADYNAITDPAGVKVYSLAKAKAEAEKLDARIKDFMTNDAYAETYAYFIYSTASASTIRGLMNSYDNWAKFVKPLAESNLALLTRANDVNHIKAVYDNYVKAATALIELGTFDYATRTYIDLFDYNGIYGDDDFDTTNKPFYDTKTAKFATPTIFTPINNAISTWKAQYKLSDQDVDDIILVELGYCYKDTKDVAGSNLTGSAVTAVYLDVCNYVKKIDGKYASFKTDIVPLVNKLNNEKYIQTSAYEAYANLKAALKTWSKDVNETNYDLIVALSGVNENYIATAANHNKPLDLVTFANDTVKEFFTNTLPTFETKADAINAQIDELEKQFKNRTLFSNLPILALEDKVVYLTKDNANVYVDRSNVVFTLEDGALVGSEFTAIHDKDTSLVPTSVTHTVYEFEQLCIAGLNGVAYEGLADYLVHYDELDALKTSMNKRIAQLKTDGATAFQTALGKVKYVPLTTDAATAAAPGLRDQNSTFAKPTDNAPANIYYVTLADEATVKAVSDIFYDWVHNKGGNSKYEEVVSGSFKLNVSGEEVSYSGGYTYVDILGEGNYDIYGNIIAQMATLTEARDAIVADFKVLRDALALGVKNGENAFLPNDLTSSALAAYRYASSKHYYTQILLETGSQITVAAVDKIKVADEAQSVAANNNIEALIKAISDAYVAFEKLNTNYNAKAEASSEKYLLNYKEGSWALKDTISALTLVYAQNRIINDYLQEFVDDNKGTADAEIVKQAIEGVTNSTKLEGNYASSVQYWVEEVDDIVGTYPTNDENYKIFGNVFFTVGKYNG